MLVRRALAIGLTGLALLGCSEPEPDAAAGDAAVATHPTLLLDASTPAAVRADQRAVPAFAASLAQMAARLEAHLAEGFDVPMPADAGGGYTHEQHKRNGVAIHDAGMLWYWTGEQRWLDTARQFLDAYAALYPTLGEHPKKKEQTPGQLFWQSLNEAVWLVYAIQGYDALLPALSAAERERYETGLFRPLVAFLSVGQPQTFDKVHNHGTWANAAVGMAGYVLGEDLWVEQALYGLDRSGEAGFLKQLDTLFSPDGYYTEGPYYQRYALMPFVLFARSIDRNEPERGIFSHRDGILDKAIHTTLQLSYAGLFFPLNDAIKDKGLDTIELDHAIAIAYGRSGDPRLLSLLDGGKVLVPTADGQAVAAGLHAGLAEPYPFASRHLRDGGSGDEGALTILRSGSGPDHAALVFKATSQGMGHGHFDRLNWLFYEQGNEVVPDYGAARFLNVEQKYGGHYLPENTTWAKQTLSHSTLVVDGESQFGGALRRAEQSAPQPLFHVLGDAAQAVAAREDTAWPGVRYARALALLDLPGGGAPVALDVGRVEGEAAHRYDLPLWYRGQFIASTPTVAAATTRLEPLGDGHGYQHVWQRGSTGVAAGEPYRFTWLLDGRFYSVATVADSPLEVLHLEVGANDPDFNLRREPGLLFRADGRRALAWATVLEPHGEYNGAREFTVGNTPRVARVSRTDAADLSAVVVETHDGGRLVVALDWLGRTEVRHGITVDGQDYAWQGAFRVFCDEGC